MVLQPFNPNPNGSAPPHQYRRTPQAQNPFLQDTPGSGWSTRHLEWLGIDFRHDRSIDSLLLWTPTNGGLVELLQSELGMPWRNIEEQGSELFGFYHSLYSLDQTSPSAASHVASVSVTSTPTRSRVPTLAPSHPPVYPSRSLTPAKPTLSKGAPSPLSRDTRHTSTESEISLSEIDPRRTLFPPLASQIGNKLLSDAKSQVQGRPQTVQKHQRESPAGPSAPSTPSRYSSAGTGNNPTELNVQGTPHKIKKQWKSPPGPSTPSTPSQYSSAVTGNNSTELNVQGTPKPPQNTPTTVSKADRSSQFTPVRDSLAAKGNSSINSVTRGTTLKSPRTSADIYASPTHDNKTRDEISSLFSPSVLKTPLPLPSSDPVVDPDYVADNTPGSAKGKARHPPVQAKVENYVTVPALFFCDCLTRILLNYVGLAGHSVPRHRLEEENFVLIDAKPHKTTIDVMWRLHVAETNQVNGVPIELKQEQHSKTEDNILGQEVSHMLAQARQQRLLRRKRDDHITTYLVSWKNLTAYFSRLDVSRDYINALERSDPLPDQISVRRSHVLDLKDPDDRVMLAKIFLGILVANLERFDRSEFRDISDRIRNY